MAIERAAEDTSAIGWYGELTPPEKRTFWACFGGWALDAMDVQIFSFVIPSIVAAFAVSNADAGFIGTVTLLTSALGDGSPARSPIVSGACARCRSPLSGSPFSRSCAGSRRIIRSS